MIVVIILDLFIYLLFKLSYQQFLVDRFWEVHENDNFSKFPLKIWFFDIETYSPDEFPKPEEASHMINVITVYDTVKKKYYTYYFNTSFLQ